MRHTWTAFLVIGSSLIVVETAAAREKIILVAEPLPAVAEPAFSDLQRVLRARGLEVIRRKTLPALGPMAVVVGTAGTAAVDRLLDAQGIALPKEAESLCIRKLRMGQWPVLLIAGRDPRGLSYALSEVARAIEVASSESDLLASVRDAVESPYLRVRSLTVHLFNADLEKNWYFDERFWEAYFAMLAGHRYNQFTLTFGDQTNYLCPLYAYLAEVPGYAELRVKGLSDGDRRRNLAMLKRISELAQERGLDFNLGIWMQMPIPQYSGKVLAEQLPEGPRVADYCARGLKLLLRECSAISGVQLRMNAEAGVPEDKQTEFYRPLFRAIRDCGRPIRLDLRYKGLRPETTQDAIDNGLDVTVSSKFWCEHMGLPYHPTVADPLYRESRYSFGAMLAYPRKYRVLYRLWTVGSQRLLLWGDPDYSTRFAQSCRLGGGEGFEVFAPLSNKGYGNDSGAWQIFADRAFEQGRWEHERYWFFYLVFGRMGYNPQTDPEVWQREFRHRFGAAAGDLETAYRQAGRVIPFLTAVRLPSASEWSWWPEMDTGDRLAEYALTQPSDSAQFYAIQTWKRTPRWRCEAWDATVRGYVEDALDGQLNGKRTPIEVSHKLRSLAETTLKSLDLARGKVRDAKSAELRATDLDLRVLAQLALYHAEKTQAATHLTFFERTNEAGRLDPALQHMRAAAAAWEQIVRLTDGVYYDKMVFGTSPHNARNKHGHHHSGHWKDRLAEVREDVTLIEQLLQKHGGRGQKYRTLPGETLLTEFPRIEQTPIETAEPDRDLIIAARVSSKAPVRQVLLHFRPLNQTADWKEVPMQRNSDGRYEGVVPGKMISTRWDVQYYLEVQVQGGGRLWPSWEQGPPYVVVKVTRPLAENRPEKNR